MLKDTRTRFQNWRTNRRLSSNLGRFARSISSESVALAHSARAHASVDKLEIVIPCFNDAHLLEETFLSALDQDTPTEITITMIDDCSQDNSFAVMSNLARSSTKGRKVRAFRNERNMNQAATMNWAIERSQADFVMALDSDDILAPHCVRTVQEVLGEREDLFMLGATSVAFSGTFDSAASGIEVAGKPLVTTYTPADAEGFAELNDLNMTQSSCCFLKAAWSLVGGYRERSERVCSYADRDFQMRVCSVLDVGVLEDMPLAWWRVDSGKGRDFA